MFCRLNAGLLAQPSAERRGEIPLLSKRPDFAVDTVCSSLKGGSTGDGLGVGTTPVPLLPQLSHRGEWERQEGLQETNSANWQ